ncbi:TetR/AcrR family transcriptional regulator [Streptomyces profundus]|uniref:TetR/AcrR family transcriptional regulator n=1 Tax=Streptomyces profundus TaxID=2867410 RepID=UPI001D16ABC5|nr:TetR family transcriptional regulator [Streptomyces sp. MA3_2.13]UED87549.1 TetR family transcriptional regulator [Streptomyces sp. MA3_2.13]
MRPSAKRAILDAAVRVTEREGITGLTLESAAVEAGVTKPGLMYHFPNRDALLLALQRHLTGAWEERLEAEVGGPAADATPREKAAAYARVGVAGGAAKADLAFMVESASRPELAAVWAALMERWAPLPTSAERREVDLLVARLAADGMWLLDATGDTALSGEVRRALGERLAELADGR